MSAVSAFLRLPRELRDEIYNYYVHADDGLHYDFESGKLLTSTDGKPVNVNLQLTCRQIASELRGIAFRENRITFATARSRLALRYSFLMRMHLHALDWMLRCCIHLVTSELLARVAQDQTGGNPTLDTLLTYEESSQRELALLSLLDTSNSCAAKVHRASVNHRIIRVETAEYSVANRELVQDILALCSLHPDFEHLTSEEVWRSGLPENLEGLQYVFGQGWQRRVLIWRPLPWAIPRREEMEEMGQLLRQPFINHTVHEHHFLEEQEAQASARSIDFFFSAAAVAFHFFQKFSTDLQSMIRHVVLLEEWKSYTFSETHGRAFLPSLAGNPKLIIERRVDLWRAVFPNIIRREPTFEDALIQHPEDFESMFSYHAADVVMNLQEWIDEAVILQQSEVGCQFALVLDGPPDTRQFVLNTLKTAAAGQETIEKIHRLDVWKPGDYTVPDHPYFFKGNRCTVGYRGVLPCYISPSFPQTVRNVMAETSIIKLDAAPGEEWDVDDILAFEEPGYEGGWDYLTEMWEFFEYSAEGRTPPSFLDDGSIRVRGEPTKWVQSRNPRFLMEWTDGMDGWDRMIEEC